MEDDPGMVVAALVGIGAIILPVIMLFNPSHPYYMHAIYSLLLCGCLVVGVLVLRRAAKWKAASGVSGVLIMVLLLAMMLIAVLWAYETFVVYTHFSNDSCAKLYADIPESCQ